jgi:hypothetical protein
MKSSKPRQNDKGELRKGQKYKKLKNSPELTPLILSMQALPLR